MARITILALVLLGACSTPWGRYREEQQRAATAAQLKDRSGMTYDELRGHLQRCRRLGAMPKEYTQAVLEEVVAQSPWSEEERRLVREGRIQLGFTEEQVRVSWGEPTNERRTIYEFGEIKYLHYGSGSTVHLRNDHVHIIAQ